MIENKRRSTSKLINKQADNDGRSYFVLISNYLLWVLWPTTKALFVYIFPIDLNDKDDNASS